MSALADTRPNGDYIDLLHADDTAALYSDGLCVRCRRRHRWAGLDLCWECRQLDLDRFSDEGDPYTDEDEGEQ